MSHDHPLNGTVQPLTQFDECAELIVAPAKLTARDKGVAIKIAKTTDFPYTLTPIAKFAELQILKPNEKKLISRVDIAALNLLADHDDVVSYITH